MIKRGTCNATIKFLMYAFPLFLILTLIVHMIEMPTYNHLTPNFKDAPLKFITKYIFQKPEAPETHELILRGKFEMNGNFKILPFIETAGRFNELSEGPLCMAMHSSLEQLDNVVHMTNNWRGSISLALAVHGTEVSLARQYVTYLKHCSPSFESQVSVHLVYPVDQGNNDNIDDTYLNLEDVTCEENFNNTLYSLIKLRNNITVEWYKKLMLPINLMRNIARDYCQNTWIISPDANTILPNILQEINFFLASNEADKCVKCAFVVPTYEIHENITAIPGDKHQLVQYVIEKKARPYRTAVSAVAEGPTDHTKWQKLSPKDNSIYIAYLLGKYEIGYEPIYIAKRGSPGFDTRFAFAMDRAEQVYDMYLAGYKFYILDNIFMCHPGFQEKITPVAERIKQDNEFFNSGFLREISVRYDADPLGVLKKPPNKYKVKVNS